MTPEERRKAQVEKEIRGHRDELQRLGMPAPLIDAMFSFTADAGNYEERRIGRDDYPWGFISTCRVSDGAKPYETAVEHGNYNNGEIVIVENYDTKEDAAAGHARWIARMTIPPLPATLYGCNNSCVQQLLNKFDENKETP